MRLMGGGGDMHKTTWRSFEYFVIYTLTAIIYEPFHVGIEI